MDRFLINRGDPVDLLDLPIHNIQAARSIPKQIPTLLPRERDLPQFLPLNRCQLTPIKSHQTFHYRDPRSDGYIGGKYRTLHLEGFQRSG